MTTSWPSPVEDRHTGSSRAITASNDPSETPRAQRPSHRQTYSTNSTIDFTPRGEGPCRGLQLEPAGDLRSSVGGCLPHREVLVTGGGEWFALPSAPAVDEVQAGELCHEVELARPHVAERDGAPLEGAVDKLEVVRDQPCVATWYSSKPHRFCSVYSGRMVSPWGSRCRSGTMTSIPNRPSGCRWRAALRKQATCAAWLVRFIRVEDQIDEGE